VGPPEGIFPDQEDSNWAYDELAEQYYLHRFYSSEPNLNVAHPDVRDEVNRIMGFWLELGVSGFMRGFLTRRRGDAVLFGEVNLDLGERETYFGDAGDEMTGLFEFIMCGTVFTAMAKEKARGVQGDRHGGVRTGGIDADLRPRHPPAPAAHGGR
jgi:maltose alpha-D-glucosyltransferase/alpha-amylase